MVDKLDKENKGKRNRSDLSDDSQNKGSVTKKPSKEDFLKDIPPAQSKDPPKSK